MGLGTTSHVRSIEGNFTNKVLMFAGKYSGDGCTERGSVAGKIWIEGGPSQRKAVIVSVEDLQ